VTARLRVMALCLLSLSLSACSTISPLPAPPRSHSAPSATTTVAPPPASRPAPADKVTETPSLSSVSAAPSPASVAACAQAVLRSLPRAQFAAQVFNVGLDVTDLGSGRDLVTQTGVGGVFLSGRSQRGLGLAPAIAGLQRSALAAGRLPLLVSADEEGGAVQSVRGPGIPLWPSAFEQSTWTLSELSSRSAGWASSLRTLGITLNLGPVADVVRIADRASNPPIGALGREYGSDPVAAAARISIVTASLQHAGVGATAKHFPGLGRVRDNTDTSNKAQDDVATAEDVNLAPFRAAIRSGASAVMVSSARYPRLDSTDPAVWSARIITTLLRGKLGFTGLVISDDLANARAVTAVPVGDRAIRFLQAGGDLVLIVDRADLLPMLTAVQGEAAASPAFKARLQQAAQHVVESKIRLGLVPCSH
jgi:beta-N-acetylhexosaminidase